VIGNDVIDLNLARQSHWRNERFLQKAFTEDEIILIKKNNSPFEMIWTLWSAKESVYKVLMQQGETSYFNPKKIICLSESSQSSLTFRYKEQILYSSTETRMGYLHTIASVNKSILPTIVQHHVKLRKPFYKNQSNMIRQEVKTFFNHLYNVGANKISIVKSSDGIPSVYYGSKRLPHYLSISHHGHVAGFALFKKM